MSNVSSVLSKYGVEIKDELVNDLENLSKIPDSRFSAVVGERNDLRAKKLEWEVEKKDFEKKLENQSNIVNDLKKYETQVNDIKKKRHTDNVNDWKKRSDLFNVKEGDKLFEKVNKVKHRFQFGEDLSDEQLTQNLEMLKTYDELDYFKVEDSSTNYNNKKPNGGTPQNSDNFYGFGSREELARADIKLYQKWKNNKE
ncbi:MAG: hypothetical protein U9N34_05205 [Candidatus Cloacimonadota bacterium]|nr:hypothetical protein [Candidatus Cloacimonadota bacterium]